MLGMRLRAPRGDREILVRPELADMPDLVTRNHHALARIDRPVLGLPFQAVRDEARRGLCPGADLIVQTGHQPTPYHPGVWIKNFLAFKLAGRVGGQSLNLIVDNDAAKHLEIVVPAMAADGGADLTRVRLPDEEPPPALPYEECPAPAFERLRTICGRVKSACHNEDMRAGFDLFWQAICEVYDSRSSIAALITAARRRLELAGGIENRPVFMSALSAARPFRLVLLHILANLPRFVEVHNAALAAYRKAHRIRNRANPVPDLAVEGDVLETPYWVWRAGEERARLTARCGPNTIDLLRGDETVLSAPRGHLLDPDRGPDLLEAALGRGWKIRARALSTTLFCRLFVADVFIHGIGGAKYDLITNAIINRFFDVDPPPYIVCSATVRLPVPTHGATADDLRRLKHRLRDLTWNPDRHLADGARRSEPFRTLIKRKRALIAQPRGAAAADRWETFSNIRRVNASLMDGAADQIAAARRRVPELERQIAADAVLGSREYAFCLFPPGLLPAFYDQTLAELSQ